MTRSYCVREKRQTECVPGSETYEVTKNGRRIMQCKCASCGITKSKFVSRQKGGFLEPDQSGWSDQQKWAYRTGAIKY